MKYQLLFLLSLSSLYAQVTPDSFYYKFDPKNPPVLNIEVNNAYPTRTVRVETQSIKVINPGDKPETESKEEALIVSPKSFTIAPGSKRTVRLLMKNKPTDTEDVYRVAFNPVSFEDSDKKQKKGMNVSVLVGAGSLIFAPPLEVKNEISWEKKGDGLEITNTGNINQLITVIKKCNSECKDVEEGKRLYPGNSLTVSNVKTAEVVRESFESDKTTFKIETDEGTQTFENY